MNTSQSYEDYEDVDEEGFQLCSGDHKLIF